MAALLFSVPSVFAVTYNWTGGEGTWNTSSGWPPGGIPTASDTVTVTEGTVSIAVTDTPAAQTLTIGGGTTAAQVTAAQDATASYLSGLTNVVVKPNGVFYTPSLGNNNGTKNGLSGNWTLDGGKITSGRFLYFGTGHLTVNSGEITANEFRIGNDVGGSLVQNGGTITTSSWFTIGENGTATYTMTGGSAKAGGNTVVGVANGTVGEMNLQGGSFTSNGSFIICYSGNNSTAKGTVNISGTASVTVPRVDVKGSNATLTLSENGVLITELINNEGGTVSITSGSLSAFSESLTVPAGFSLAPNVEFVADVRSDVTEYIKSTGNLDLQGRLMPNGNVTAGTSYKLAEAASFTFGDKTFDQWAATMPTLSLTNTGTEISAGVIGGDMYLRADSDGSWNRFNNWNLKSGDTVYERYLGGMANNWTVDGGTIDAAGKLFYFGDATVTMNDGSITAAEFRVGNAGTTGSFTMHDGTIDATSFATVGESGSGTFTMDGGTFNTVRMVLGVNANTGTFNISDGTLNVTGVMDADWTCKGYGLSLGFQGNAANKGILNVTDKGEVNVPNGIMLQNQSELNISGGTVTTGKLGRAAGAENSVISLDGGTLNVTELNTPISFTDGVLNAESVTVTLGQSGGTLSPGGNGVIGSTRLMGCWSVCFSRRFSRFGPLRGKCSV